MNAKEMVAAADWMDGQKPGWEHQIDLGPFDITQNDVCILGQAFGKHGFITQLDSIPDAFAWVFCTVADEPEDMRTDNDSVWPTVEQFWIDEIKERVNR